MFSLLMDTAAEGVTAQPTQGGGLLGFLPFILMFAIVYFLMIRPQQKKQKEVQKMLNELNVGDRVITSGGMIGKIVNIKKDKNSVVIRVDEATNTKIEFQRNAISAVISKVESKEIEESEKND